MTTPESAARELAREHRAAGTRRGRRGTRLGRRLDRLTSSLETAIRDIAGAPPDARFPFTGAEWLLDNEYLVRESIEQVRKNLPPGFYGELPRQLGAGASVPRIQAVVRAALDAKLDHLDPAFLELFVAAYQEVQPLKMGELWALPTIVRLLTLEDLAVLAERLARGSRERKDGSEADAELNAEREIAACIRTLRVVQSHDWSAFFESVSFVERALAGDPAEAYTRMDFETRDRYRSAVERLARRSGRGEREVAAAAIGLATDSGTARRRHVGWWLTGGGRPQLARALGARHDGRASLAAAWKRHGPAVWVGTLLAAAVMLLVALGAWLVGRGVGLGVVLPVLLVASVPAQGVVIALANWLVTLFVRPAALPKLDLSSGIPPESRTLVVVPCLLTDAGEVDLLLERLEITWLGNLDPHLSCALLADFVDAEAEEMPEDADLERRARDGIRTLNRRHGSPDSPAFHLFVRRRLWNAAEDRWMGWERKRGKLTELNRLLRGARDTSFLHPEEPPADLDRVRYVITLDADTRLPAGVAARLVGALTHPLNVAEFSEDGREVVEGYTVIQPRVETLPSSASQTLFSRIASGDVMLDLYSHAVSDVYQDLFREGIYAGKGIYDLDAFERSLARRAPENALLSHDLFEGVHGRAALASDVVLYEEYPGHPKTWYRRMHRWIRGDWQIAPWVPHRVPVAGGGRERNRLGLLDRWKILDNLRRSLQAPALIALLLVGFFVAPLPPIAWTLLVVAAAVLPAVLSGLTPVVAVVRHGAWRGAARAATTALGMGLVRVLIQLSFLPYEAVLVLDAIGRTVWRMAVTRKHLLAWVPAAVEERRRLGLGPRRTWPAAFVPAATALLVGALLAALRPSALPAALPLLLLWLAAPAWADVLARRRPRRRLTLTADEQTRVRRLARRTWLFFDRFVRPGDHWLPPDHFQEEPRGEPAHRTSPTNIGMSLLSVLGAWDLGYITPLGLAARVGNTLSTLQRLRTHRGHLLNWYDTHELKPLVPVYVSTVDSGNLAGALLALASGLDEARESPLVRPASGAGLTDSLDLFEERLDAVDDPAVRAAVPDLVRELGQLRERLVQTPSAPAPWASLVRELRTNWLPNLEERMVRVIRGGTRVRRRTWTQRLHVWLDQVRQHVHMLDREVVTLAPWMDLALDAPDAEAEGIPFPEDLRARWGRLRGAMLAPALLRELPERAAKLILEAEALASRLAHPDVPAAHAAAGRQYLERLTDAAEASALRSATLLERLEDLARQARARVRAMDFRFLYDREQKLFRIGHNLTTGEPDPNHYDLLASEARVASYVAITKHDVPVEHWLHLGRPLTRIRGDAALLSWSATMFEYLMPTLLMRHPEGTLLEQSCRVAVRRQLSYGLRRGPAWGISESGFYAFDQDQNYQYRAFGVPGLGFRRDLADDLVFTPYACLLALPMGGRRVLDNLDRLDQLGMLGRYGYYEAVDLTPERFPAGQAFGIVRSYMAHHQGMILTAIVNALHEGRMVERFHRDPNVATAEHLLWEHVPRGAPLERLPAPVSGIQPDVPRPARAEPWAVEAPGGSPEVATLSNGRYGVLVTASGTGTSTWRGRQLVRDDPDPTLEAGGVAVYVLDEDTDDLRSATLQPCGSWPDDAEVVFAPHKVEFHRRDDGIFLRTEVGVAPVEDVEIRRVHVGNETDRVRRLTIVSYAEVVLAAAEEDRRHPAFSKLFVEADRTTTPGAVVFHRRPRSEDERPLFFGHAVWVQGRLRSEPAICTDRERFIGRGGSLRAPVGLREEPTWDGSATASLDPVAAIRCQLELEPHGEADVVFLWAASRSYEEVRQGLDLYAAAGHASWAFELARARSERELQSLDLAPARLPIVQQLLSRVLWPDRRLRSAPPPIDAPLSSQSGLWSTGVSGDHPILLVRVAADTASDLVALLLRSHAWWSRRGVRIDLVLIDEEHGGYEQPARERLHRELRSVGLEDRLNRPGGVYILARERLGAGERAALEQGASVTLDTESGDLEHQITLPQYGPGLPALLATEVPEPPRTIPAPSSERLLFDNGVGGFTPDGKEYVVRLEPGTQLPAPWANVLANEQGGVLVTEAGIGSAWALNSGESRLTPWRNDPVLDPPSTVIYVRDEETTEVWSPTPAPCPAHTPHEVRHRAGETVWRHRSHGLDQELVVHATIDEPAFVMRLQLVNLSKRPRRFTVTCYTEWTLGTTSAKARPHLLTAYAHDPGALLARNPFNETFGDHVAFLVADRPTHGLTCDRKAFLGRNGDVADPNGLHRIGLQGTIVSDTDPCGVLQVHVDLPSEGTEVVHFAIGQGKDRAAALERARRLSAPGAADAERSRVHARWEDLLTRVQVETPEPATNLLLNGWLTYQNLGCRLEARTAFYQSSGAFGFRDQLQDVLALLPVEAGIVRAHLLEAASHQFEEGDVLHWWHPPTDRGVRTRCSDDLLWLPYATAAYVRATGDDAVLDEEIPYLAGAPLRPRERERYAAWDPSEHRASLYEHCLAAIDRGSTSGAHGLPLLGTSDWNDGFDRVGEKGRGESVWLGFFLASVKQDFAEIAEARGDGARALSLRKEARGLLETADDRAWDGDWYLRAWSDDGSPIGSHANVECRIDAIAQAWSVISREGQVPAKGRRALAAALEHLVSRDDRLVILLRPPFDRAKPHPGYIRGYPPGIRENGGQYSHASVWVAWACSVLRKGDETAELFDLLNPILRTGDQASLRRYRVEPYAYAADIGGAPPYVGRGGWTWYTGSAAWAWRLGIERILGFRLEGRSFRIAPCIPDTWSGYRMTWRAPGATYDIVVRRERRLRTEVRLDGKPVEDGRVPVLEDGRTHDVEVVLATADRTQSAERGDQGRTWEPARANPARADPASGEAQATPGSPE